MCEPDKKDPEQFLGRSKKLMVPIVLDLQIMSELKAVVDNVSSITM